MTVILTPTGGVSSSLTGTGVFSQNLVNYTISTQSSIVAQTNPNNQYITISTIPIQFNAQQIGGLVKMLPCSYSDCRILPQRWCYRLPVFGANTTNQPAGYSNDYNTFLINFSGQGTPSFVIQKQTQSFFDAKGEVSGAWNTVATITDNTYGIYNALGSISGHSTYMMFQVNWGNVYTLLGNGVYRILFQSCVTTQTGGTGQVQPLSGIILNPWTFAENSGFMSGGVFTWNSVNISISIKWDGTTYTVPAFNQGQNGTVPSLTGILAAINGATGPNFPFTGVLWNNISTGYFQIQGTKYASQNGAIVTINYTYYDDNGNKLTTPFPFTQPNPFGGGTNGSSTTTTNCTCGLQSPPFLLWNWDCIKAHGTTKFETWSIGTLGDVNNPGALFDLCGLSLYDSLRIEGFFGYNEFTYDELLLEYGQQTQALFGTMERVRDKAIPGYKWNSNLLPTWIHKQLATVMMMADTVLVSDYNINNPDYFINRKNVIKKGSYKPKYQEKGKHSDLVSQDFFRRDPVSVEFVEGVQSIIKSTSCINS